VNPNLEQANLAEADLDGMLCEGIGWFVHREIDSRGARSGAVYRERARD